jgi:hypothetical protein
MISRRVPDLRTRVGVLVALCACTLSLACAGLAQGASGEVELGLPNLVAYCQSLGYTSAVFTQENPKQWGCRHADGTITPLDVQQACEFSFKQRPIVAVQLTPGVLYTWACYQLAPGAAGPGGAGPGAAPVLVRAALLRALVPNGPGAKIAALLRRGGYSFRFTAPRAGRLSASWYYVPRGAHLSRSARPTLVASGRASFARAGTATVKLVLTAKGKRLLRHARRIRITARATFLPAIGPAITALQTFTLTR